LARVALGLVVLTALGFGVFRYQNRPPQLLEPNYYVYYQKHDRQPVGKVAVLVTQLIMPEDFRAADYAQIALKSTQYIPWPIRLLARRDRGVVLLDSERFYEFAAFTPTRLVDAAGSDRDVDGIAYVEKYRRGEVRWVAPSPRQHLDHGYFLLESRQGGMPTLSQKLVTKARVYYHGRGFSNHKLPHEAGMRLIAEGTMARIQAKYGPIDWRFVTADNAELLRRAVEELLDAGAETLVLAPAAPIYSHHEEFNGSFKHAMHDVEDWSKRHGRKVKVIITPQLGDFPVLRQAFLGMLKDRLDSLPKGPQVDVRVAVSVHGMPWDSVPHEAWLKLAPPYRDAMLRDAQALLDGYDFGRTQVVLAQDHFADPVSNPRGTYLSTNKAFKDGIAEKYEYVINLPIEFFAENSDTMFSHAMFNFEDLPGFDRYETIAYEDWTVPFTRDVLVGGTHLIYNGVPVGRYNLPIIEAHFLAIDSVLSRQVRKPRAQEAAAAAVPPRGSPGARISLACTAGLNFLFTGYIEKYQNILSMLDDNKTPSDSTESTAVNQLPWRSRQREVTSALRAG
jgi:protoheme ferro-lyase